MSNPNGTRIAIAIRHVAFEDLGSFEPVLADAGFDVRYHDAGLGTWPSAAMLDADLLVVLGGPIGAYEADRYPFLRDEIAVLRRRLAARCPTLGICLGAQLMAHAQGADVYPGAREIGYAEVTLTAAGQNLLPELVDMHVLHWHGDTFDLPPGADLLASTEACRNQAFALGHHALGLQFHLEAGGEAFERWLIGHAVELAKAGIDPVTLRADNLVHERPLQEAGAACLRRWLAGLETDS